MSVADLELEVEMGMPRRWDGAAVDSAAVATTSSVYDSDSDSDKDSDYDSYSDCDFDACDGASANVGAAFGRAQLEACNR